MSAPLAARLIAGGARLLSGATVVNRGDRPTTRPAVYFANHTSHLDFVVLWAALPPEVRTKTRPVAAGDYWRKGTLRPWLVASVFRAVLVERDAATVEQKREQVERMARALAAGDSLILFPEGTRGSGEAIAPFKSGLWHLARGAPEVPLVPVRLEGLHRILPKGEILPVPILARMIVGPPLRIEPAEAKEPFLARTRAALVDLAPLPAEAPK